MSPAGLGTKNNCAGKGQQQFTQLTDSELGANQQLQLLVGHEHGSSEISIVRSLI
jgi:hypothetical protein